jgi:hypothetical protein
MANLPVAEFGSTVIWPQQPDTPIYHNRAMWPFVSAYALRAARTTGNADRIAFEIRSLMRGAAKASVAIFDATVVARACRRCAGAGGWRARRPDTPLEQPEYPART